MKGYVKVFGQEINLKNCFIPLNHLPVLRGLYKSDDTLSFAQALGMEMALVLTPFSNKWDLLRNAQCQSDFKDGKRDNPIVQFFLDKTKLKAFLRIATFTSFLATATYNATLFPKELHDVIFLLTGDAKEAAMQWILETFDLKNPFDQIGARSIFVLFSRLRSKRHTLENLHYFTVFDMEHVKRVPKKWTAVENVAFLGSIFDAFLQYGNYMQGNYAGQMEKAYRRPIGDLMLCKKTHDTTKFTFNTHFLDWAKESFGKEKYESFCHFIELPRARGRGPNSVAHLFLPVLVTKICTNSFELHERAALALFSTTAQSPLKRSRFVVDDYEDVNSF